MIRARGCNSTVSGRITEKRALKLCEDSLIDPESVTQITFDLIVRNHQNMGKFFLFFFTNYRYQKTSVFKTKGEGVKHKICLIVNFADQSRNRFY